MGGEGAEGKGGEGRGREGKGRGDGVEGEGEREWEMRGREGQACRRSAAFSLCSASTVSRNAGSARGDAASLAAELRASSAVVNRTLCRSAPPPGARNFAERAGGRSAAAVVAPGPALIEPAGSTDGISMVNGSETLSFCHDKSAAGAAAGLPLRRKPRLLSRGPRRLVESRGELARPPPRGVARGDRAVRLRSKPPRLAAPFS